MNRFSLARGLVTSICAITCAFTASGGCGSGDEVRPPASTAGVFGLSKGCFAIDAAPPGKSRGPLLVASQDGLHFELRGRTLADASRLTLQATDLGMYLLRDAEGRYLVGAEDGTLARVETLDSDVSLNDDAFVSPAEWEALPIPEEPSRMKLRQRATGLYLGASELVEASEDGAQVAFYETTDCTPFPELTLDANGKIARTHFDDGDLFGAVDTHSHLFTNHAFGGGGVFHGAPYHRLGVEHALSSCEANHGAEGRKDVVGYFFGGGDFSISSATSALVTGKVSEFNHFTDGYPTFTDWPSSWGTATHQTQYYRWIERAYLGGLRLIVQHATSNQVLCELTDGINSQTPRMSCNEMVSAERSIEETRALERYIDAQHGGPGRGWLRVVESPAEAREVVGSGKLAVILGIETSNLFDCFLNPPAGTPKCDEAMVRERLDRVHDLGVRALFPVHKYDNGFSAGDGHRGFIELGNFVSSSQYANFTDVDCPDVPAPFDQGGLTFGGLNMPRVEYDAAPAVDMTGFSSSPVGTLVPYLSALQAPPMPGDFCQNAGLTPLGETLMLEMMLRGMIIEVDHFPRRSYARAYELLTEHDYPAAGTHGSDNRGELYALGGVSKLNLDRCVDASNPDAPMESLRAHIATIADAGAYPAQGFGFDLNGFAGGPRPRFGDDASCATPQADPISYPFTSYGGDVTFTQPWLGEREVDFNTEGMAHLGLLPELIQDARNVGYTDADLEPIFRSAEGYIRMWELAEARAAELRTTLTP